MRCLYKEGFKPHLFNGLNKFAIHGRTDEVMSHRDKQNHCMKQIDSISQ